jgi:hypothetical protein
MKRIIKFLKESGKYLRELSVVVIGIAISFSINNWINERSEKKDMTLYLNAVKVELEENSIPLQSLKKHYERCQEYSNYLLTHDRTLMDKDTLFSYTDIEYSTQPVLFTTSAFEMLKTSGYMRFIEDKDFLKSIWTIYNGLSTIEKASNSYAEEKMKSIFIDIKSGEITEEALDKRTFRIIPMHDFFLLHGHGLHNSYIRDCNNMSELINEVLPKF